MTRQKERTGQGGRKKQYLADNFKKAQHLGNGSKSGGKEDTEKVVADDTQRPVKGGLPRHEAGARDLKGGLI